MSDGDDSDNGTTAAASHVKPKVVSQARTKTVTGPIAARSNPASRASKASSKALKSKSKASVNSVQEVLTADTDGLPIFARAKWSTSFLPTLYARLGSASNPLKPYEEGSSMLDMIQGILDMVYPNSGYRVRIGDKIYSMVCIALEACQPKETNTCLG